MATILHAFCVVCCFVSAAYFCIITYYFRNVKSSIWFAVLAFFLGIHLKLIYSMNPTYLWNPAYTSSISANFYLATYCLVTFFLNLHLASISGSTKEKENIIYESVGIVMSAGCMLVPSSAMPHVYIILVFYSLVMYVVSMVTCFRLCKEHSKTFIYPTISYALLILLTIPGIIAFLLRKPYYEARLLVSPIFMFFHAIMLARQYSESINHSKKLSASLEDTLERINNSHNALMCTQMKSEFLYRSLDLISKKCDEDPYVAEDLTVSLSKYLRHTLNFQQLKGIVPLSNEIELTKAYISIEKQRYPHIKFEYHFPDPLPDFHIPPLSIQPLVENAIEHGLNDKEKDAKLSLSIISYRDSYHIDVSDNGNGMDEETVKELTDSLNETARIGLYNIHTRLVNLFGKGLVIQSAPGVGTSVSFVVPPDVVSYLGKEGADEKAE